jgi:DNA ligase D-like protein (predicted ligase)
MIKQWSPMLAVPSEPFDSPEYLFEVKWNGIRSLAAREAGGLRLWGRDLADYFGRYPELAGLERLPCGTVLDGELVQFAAGVPDLDALLARHQFGSQVMIHRAAQSHPVHYVLFDLLAYRGQPLLGQPLKDRRQRLEELVHPWQQPRLLLSEGVIGPGKQFFEQAVRQGQEGIMAKHLASRYQPGTRSSAWRKIKPKRQLPCVILGWLPGQKGFGGLLLAACWQGCLRYVASVRTGFTQQSRAELQGLLASRVCARPLVACPKRGHWVKPGVYCQVRFLEWTRSGRLRGASFERLLRYDEAGLCPPAALDARGVNRPPS